MRCILSGLHHANIGCQVQQLFPSQQQSKTEEQGCAKKTTSFHFVYSCLTNPWFFLYFSRRLHYMLACILIALMGLIVDVPLYTLIVMVKSLYMLFKGWFRLIHYFISWDGLFLKTACIPIVGLAIFLWPIIVIVSILGAIFSSFFVGLYGLVMVYWV